MTSLQEASAVLFLSLGGWETIPVGIFAFYIAGSANEAAALGVVLIVVAAVSLLVINRVAGTRLGGMFGGGRDLRHLPPGPTGLMFRFTLPPPARSRPRKPSVT